MADEPGESTGGRWLPPSEALTRFAPDGQANSGERREPVPVRFGFRIGELGFLVPLGMLSEVLDTARIYPIPMGTPWFLGLTNLRGNLVPVFDLKRFLGLDDPSEAHRNLLVLGTEAEAVGVPIDGLPRNVETRKPLDESPPLPDALREQSRGVYTHEGVLWIEFDFDGLFRAAAGSPSSDTTLK